MSLNVIVNYKNHYKAMNSLNQCLDLENKDDEYTRPCMTWLNGRTAMDGQETNNDTDSMKTSE